MKKIRILLIENNRILRDGIKAMINKHADLKLVAASGRNHHTLLQVQTLSPHVVLINLGRRTKTGFAWLRTFQMISQRKD